MALQISPSISYAEVSLPLPESPKLWNARTAQEWKDLYLANVDLRSMRIPSLTEAIANLDDLQSSSNSSDLAVACSAVLHCIWGLVWEYRQLSLLLHNPVRYWDSGLVMSSRYEELIKMLENFRIGYKYESTLFLELVLMHMHMSLNEIQALASLGDLRDGHKVQSSVGEWAKSKASRQAVWHAGQVIREIKSLPYQRIRDFVAVALYHASLTIWAYGIASRMVDFGNARPHSASTRPPRTPLESHRVLLDGEENDDIRRYIALERGTPSLQSAQRNTPPISLNNPRAVLEIVIGVMGRGYDSSSEQKPPLVENLLYLIERLRDATVDP